MTRGAAMGVALALALRSTCLLDVRPRGSAEGTSERGPTLGDEPTTPAPDPAPRAEPTAPAPSDAAAARPTGAATDPRGAGPHAVETRSGDVTVANGCQMRHGIISPRDTPSRGTIVLAPGFTRPPSSMEPFARHLASWGFTVITAPLCSNSPLGVDHPRNGEALAQLADALDLDDVVFSGFSAGGLAAFLAAARSDRTAGYVGLDAVDWGGLAAKAASSFAKPAWFLLAEPSSCNASGNFAPVLAAIPNRHALRVTSASHVDVELGDCDALGLACTMCGAVSPERHALFLLLATTAALEIVEPSGSAETWWTPGAKEHDELLAAGVIAPVTSER